jgi:GNAT superfamily N-acetyltransferase
VDVSIKPVSYAELFAAPNFKDLVRQYDLECSLPQIGPIDPQPQMYAALEAAGAMQCFGAYQGDVLIGFASVLASVLPHYGRKVASIESLFVAKSHRMTGAGTSLMLAVESFAAAFGCVGIGYSAPVGSQLERVLIRRGQYKRTHSVFYMRLP